MNIRKLVASLNMAALLAIPVLANATTVTECLADLTTLRSATAAAPFLRDDQGTKLQDQLLFHVDKASTQLNKADLKDALRQMDGYLTDLQRGVDAAKIAAADAQPLQGEAEGVVACINAIG
jgi:hypothetical protein